MADIHVRAKCLTTGAIAALPKRALELGAFPNWTEVPGPVPRRHKPRVNLRSLSEPSETADQPEE